MSNLEIKIIKGAQNGATTPDKLRDMYPKINENFGNVKAEIDGVTSQIAERVNQLNEFCYSYSYNADGAVNAITEKYSDGTTLSTTAFTYTANGDVDTSVKVMDGQTITTQYIYDANGNLTDTVNTKA